MACFGDYLILEDDVNKRAPIILRRLRLEWLFRVFREPNRIGKRALKYFIIIPKLILEEIKYKRKNKENNT